MADFVLRVERETVSNMHGTFLFTQPIIITTGSTHSSYALQHVTNHLANYRRLKKMGRNHMERYTVGKLSACRHPDLLHSPMCCLPILILAPRLDHVLFYLHMHLNTLCDDEPWGWTGPLSYVCEVPTSEGADGVA